AESPGYITESEPEMELEENDGDNKKSEGDSIDYLTSEGDNDANDDGDDLSEDDADDEDEEESSDSEEEEEEHLAPTVPAPARYSFVSASDETEPFEEGETAATPLPFGYRVAARISVQPHILMPFRSESEVERLLAIPTPPLSPASPTSYPLPPFLMPLPIFTLLPTSSFPLPSSIPFTFGSESIPEADIPLQKRARFTTPTSRYKIGESSIAATAARQIRPTLTIADKRPRTVRPTRECTYKDYLNCGPLKFNGTEGVIGLTRWFERTKSVFSISNCISETQVKFASFTLIGSALTWWNSHMRAVSQEVSYAMPWRTLKQMMTVKYCPRGEIKKLEVELWNLKGKGTDITSYTL
nr:reverse transcriptase domain-containing protein [Tanacetum cinerariifolium]